MGGGREGGHEEWRRRICYIMAWLSCVPPSSHSSPNTTVSSALGTDILSSPCNLGCNCTSTIFEPVCGANGLTYFSPCRAGCDKYFPSGDTEVCQEAIWINTLPVNGLDPRVIFVFCLCLELNDKCILTWHARPGV